MITTKELRLGNWYLYKNKHEIQLDISDMNQLYKAEKFINNLEPIPLTEEWLLKLGFKEDEMLYRLKHKEYEIKMLFYDCWRLMIDSRFEQATLTGYWAVHEIQNLIFAITGEELNLYKQNSTKL